MNWIHAGSIAYAIAIIVLSVRIISLNTRVKQLEKLEEDRKEN